MTSHRRSPQYAPTVGDAATGWFSSEGPWMSWREKAVPDGRGREDPDRAAVARLDAVQTDRNGAVFELETAEQHAPAGPARERVVGAAGLHQIVGISPDQDLALDQDTEPPRQQRAQLGLRVWRNLREVQNVCGKIPLPVRGRRQKGLERRLRAGQIKAVGARSMPRH